MKLAEVSENKRSILRGSFGSAAATLLARILGLVRVQLEAGILGGGEKKKVSFTGKVKNLSIEVY